ncbi:SMI1/KNR4 family protein [Emticicia agri]|uniref:Knr4/Smi1-like domain-containing protein n=1 Tax=Emticicia agri TaxID=2492393 RepID=A0A4Q5M427_9BACT|nr:SMI1/KNR4 family protein [Emticicia agri]RYU97072.1 hypothetical protein EWM59_03955 [Emticicia agri]
MPFRERLIQQDFSGVGFAENNHFGHNKINPNSFLRIKTYYNMKGIELFIKRESPIDLSVFDNIEKHLQCSLPYDFKLFMSEYLPEPQMDEVSLLIILLPRKVDGREYAHFYGLTTIEFISNYDRFSIQEPLDSFLFVGISIPEGGIYLKLEGEDKGSVYYFDFSVYDLEEESTKIASNFIEFIESIEFEPS